MTRLLLRIIRNLPLNLRHQITWSQFADEISCQKFSPMAVQSLRTDPVSTTECLTVAILLPFRVCPKGMLSVCVLNGDRKLEITTVWTKALYIMSIIHKNWLNIDSMDRLAFCKHHLKFLGLELFMKPYRKRSEEHIKSVGSVLLQITV